MVESFSLPDSSGHLSEENLLESNEIVVGVDDSEESVAILQNCLEKRDLPTMAAGSIDGLLTILGRHRVALVLLDLELPDRNSNTVLEELTGYYPDLGIIIVTATTDLETALNCLRDGADDYLTKPINDSHLYYTVVQVLRKRKLIIENRVHRRELQLTNLRTQFLHHLILKMNSGYLSEMELEVVLQTILIGITSEEGLAFNRAFLALFDEDGSTLKGELTIGPDNREDALVIWEQMKNEKLDLQALFQQTSEDMAKTNGVVNDIIRSLQIPASQIEHPLIQACMSRYSILVDKGIADIDIPEDLIATLNQDSFVIVPLYSPARSLGVIIADNFITGKAIEKNDVKALEIFAGQASLAIEHSRLYSDMQEKIEELELITEELEQNKDLLIESERFSALGQMSAQLVHALRNPTTSIGGTARLLDKRISEQRNKKFLNVLTKESAKVESTLNDLFNFVTDTKLAKQKQSLFDIVKRSVMVFYGTMKKHNISYKLELPEDEVLLNIDGEKICQAFMHLIRNSIESMDGGGILSVGTDNHNTTISILISDTGTGIINGDIARVTDPFYTTKTYGTGMGLTLVEQILKQHDARFALSANKDQGMTATVTFDKN